MKRGDVVTTCYGDGILLHYREIDSVYEIELPFGTLFCSTRPGKEDEDDVVAAAVPSSSSSRGDETNNSSGSKMTTTMELNVACEALEKMRQLNLEVECQERGVAVPCSSSSSNSGGSANQYCTACLLAIAVPHGNEHNSNYDDQDEDDDEEDVDEDSPRNENGGQEAVTAATTTSSSSANVNVNDNAAAAAAAAAAPAAPAAVRFPRLQRFRARAVTAAANAKAKVQETKQKAAAARRQRRQRQKQKQQQPVSRLRKGTACLICGSPACKNHSSATFRKESITVCCSCERVFDAQFVVDCLAAESNDDRIAKMRYLVDLYDRVLLLLRYSSQYLEETAAQLEKTTVRQNRVGLGSASAGVVSGVLGVAACAAIFTPAGPPLLIASLLFGGSASAAQTGTEVRNYYSQPNQLADRVIALHGMCCAVLRVVGCLRDALCRDHVRTDQYDDDSNKLELLMLSDDDNNAVIPKKHRGTVLAGVAVGAGSMAGMEIGNLVTAAEVGTAAGRNARFFSRTGAGVMRTASLARFAGGALAAATLVFEAGAMAATIKNIRAGHPCEKAATLRQIRDDIADLPPADRLDEECRTYARAMSHRKAALTRKEATDLLLEASEAAATTTTTTTTTKTKTTTKTTAETTSLSSSDDIDGQKDSSSNEGKDAAAAAATSPTNAAAAAAAAEEEEEEDEATYSPVKEEKHDGKPATSALSATATAAATATSTATEVAAAAAAAEAAAAAAEAAVPSSSSGTAESDLPSKEEKDNDEPGTSATSNTLTAAAAIIPEYEADGTFA